MVNRTGQRSETKALQGPPARRRLLDRASIRLEIEQLEIELRDGVRAEASFRQAYSSPSYSDVVRETLELIEDGGEWLIVDERAEAP